MRRLRILLADDHSQILTHLKMMLETAFQVVGTVEDGQSLIDAAQVLRPGLVLTDIDMPVMNGIEATRELRKVQPHCRVICHSSHGEPEVMAAAFAAGASGYLVNGSSQSLISAIRTVIHQVWKHKGDLVMGRAPESCVPWKNWTQFPMASYRESRIRRLVQCQNAT